MICTFAHYQVSNRIQLAGIVLAFALAACSWTPDTESGSLQEIKQSQVMPLSKECMGEHAPLRPVRHPQTYLGEVAKACMHWARNAVR